MKIIVVLMNWIRMTPPQMAAFAHGIAQKMSANNQNLNVGTDSNPVTSQQLDDAANAVELAYANRMNGPLAKTQLQQADKALDDLLHTEAAYVSEIAAGDKAVIEAAGFVATSDSRKPATLPDTPNAPKVSGNASKIHFETNKVPGADSYCWIIYLDTPGTATVTDTHISLTSTGQTILINEGHLREDLHNVIPSGSRINVQVLAQNSAGMSGISPMITYNVGG